MQSCINKAFKQLKDVKYVSQTLFLLLKTSYTLKRLFFKKFNAKFADSTTSSSYLMRKLSDKKNLVPQKSNINEIGSVEPAYSNLSNSKLTKESDKLKHGSNKFFYMTEVHLCQFYKGKAMLLKWFI